MNLKHIITAFLLSFSLLVSAQPLVLDWVAEYPCLAPNSLEYDKVVTDDDQNVYLLGTAVSSNSPWLYSTAILTLKYDSTGSLLWESKFDNMFSDQFYDCAFNGDDALIVAGQRGSLPGSDPGRAEIVNYDSESGGQLWHTFIFDTVAVGANLNDIDLDEEGNIYAFGVYNSDMVYDSNKMFVAKVASGDGEILWTNVFQKEFAAIKGKVMADRIRIFGGRFLGVFDYTNLLIDIDFDGNTIASADLLKINYGPGIYNPYFFFDGEGYLITFGYKVCKFGVAEDPVWCLDFAQGLPGMIGQAMTAVTDETGNVYATGYLRDTVTEAEFTQTVKLSPDGELLWSTTDKYSDETTLERGDVMAVSDHHVFVCSFNWYYDDNGNPLNDDYRPILYSNEDGSILYDTLIDANVFDIPFNAHYNKGHFYLLGRSYDPWGSSAGYQYKLFKFSVDETVDVTGVPRDNNEVRIFPNPTNGWLTISQMMEKRFNQAQLYDAEGRLVFSKGLDIAEQVLWLPDLPSGVYLIKLSGKGAGHTEKLVVDSRL
jgi:Secretion system C-terminal sorting domain